MSVRKQTLMEGEMQEAQDGAQLYRVKPRADEVVRPPLYGTVTARD